MRAGGGKVSGERITHPRRGLILLIAVLGFACSGERQVQSPDAADIEANNRGVGLMGYFDYEGARGEFALLATKYPDWDDVQVNLAIATLNRQREGDEAAALAIVRGVLERDAGHLRAHYVSGLLSLNAGESEAALEHFERVAQADPADAYAAYYAALCRAQLGRSEEALAGYQQAIGLDPYLRSAYYGAFQSLQKLKRRDAARAMLEQFQRLAGNPQARLAEFKYTRMGKRGAAMVVDLESSPPPVYPGGEWFAEAVPLSTLPDMRASGRTGMTLADIDGDGRLDLYLPRTGSGSLVAAGRADGSFAAQPSHPLSGVTSVRSALWGDLDNDGLADVYLLRDGANQLWRQRAPGQWLDITETSGTAAGQLQSADGAILDADHDGDLDLLVVNEDGPWELLNNNLDGTFRPLAASQGLDAGGRPARSVLATDLDGDRDTDLIVVHAEPPNAIYMNDRLWAYREAQQPRSFRERALLAAVAGDLDADGEVELYAVEKSGAVLRWRRRAGDGDWELLELAAAGTAGEADRAQLALADLDGDGLQELVFTVAGGWRAAKLVDGALGPAQGGDIGEDGHWLLANLALPGGPSVIGAADGAAPRIWRPGSGRHPFLGLSLTGLEEAADSMRSNASGIGARVDVRFDSQWRTHSTFRAHSGPGQSLQPLFFGLAGHAAADYVAMTWSDGVFQTELGLETGKLHSVTETQRQLSSCPVLFAWDGERFSFVSDLLGVGGIGFNTGFGQYAQSRPWEYFLLPGTVAARNDGRLALKITEPMEEIAYIDSAKLHAYRLPDGWRMVLDERMGLNEPMPSGRPVFFREEWSPLVARNERGEDVRTALARADGRAAPLGEKDRRFIGRLAGEHVLTLGFGRELAGVGRQAWLVADGWVEYPYSQTGFAAWQAGAEFEAPTLEAGNDQGEWQTLALHFGYPAGMPRRMALPLANLPPGTTKLRLRTNLEIYWDRVAVAFEEPAPDGLTVQELPLLAARMEEPGFPLRINGPQRRPDYDFDRRVPLWDTRHPAGFYTAFGDARDLVVETDDALAIVGPGEALALEFAAPVRDRGEWLFVLETRGWAKDMDLFTSGGGRVGPLPVSGTGSARRNALHSRYNTRFEAGH